jgi:hypothetical protein
MLSLINSPPRQTLWLALLLGVVGDQLSFGVGLTGPVVLVWLSLLVLAAVWLARHSNWCGPLGLWGGIAVLAAGLRLWLALPSVDLALFLVIGTAAAQILLRTARISFLQADVFQQLFAYVTVPLRCAFGGFTVLGRLDIKPSTTHPMLLPVLRGLLLACPLLLVFTLLFAAADVTFENYLSQLSALVSKTTLQHLLLVLIMGWLALGLLASAWQPRSTYASPALSVKLGDTETLVLMGLLAMLFVAFAMLQMSHLLHDGAGIAQSTGLTIAEYARHGFFQLLWIAALALAVLQALALCCRNQQLFAGFAALLSVCVLVVLASAVQRMLLYVDSFGLSIDRVEATTVMVWLAGSLLLFAGTVLRNRPAGFASGAVSLGVVVCLALTLLNPAALVTRINIERSLNRQLALELDLDYLHKLGADAVPTLLDYFPQLPPKLQCEIGMVLVTNWLAGGNSAEQHLQDWRRWNHAWYRAENLVQERSEQLLTAAARSGNAYYLNRAYPSGPPPAGLTCQ